MAWHTIACFVLYVVYVYFGHFLTLSMPVCVFMPGNITPLTIYCRAFYHACSMMPLLPLTPLHTFLPPSLYHCDFPAADPSLPTITERTLDDDRFGTTPRLFSPHSLDKTFPLCWFWWDFLCCCFFLFLPASVSSFSSSVASNIRPSTVAFSLCPVGSLSVMQNKKEEEEEDSTDNSRDMHGGATNSTCNLYFQFYFSRAALLICHSPLLSLLLPASSGPPSGQAGVRRLPWLAGALAATDGTHGMTVAGMAAHFPNTHGAQQGRHGVGIIQHCHKHGKDRQKAGRHSPALLYCARLPSGLLCPIYACLLSPPFSTSSLPLVSSLCPYLSPVLSDLTVIPYL